TTEFSTLSLHDALPISMSFDVFDKGTPALDGKALRRQVTIYFSADKAGPKIDMPIYLPAGAKKPVPLLLCLNFSANAIDDPGAKDRKSTRLNSSHVKIS